MSSHPASSLTSRFLVRLIAVITMAFGAVLCGGGVYLLWLGGSAYFVLAGAVLVASGGLIFRYKPIGAIWFAAVYVGTLIWALWDVGLQFWPLASRLFCLTIVAILIASIYPSLCRAAGIFKYHALSNTWSFVLSIALILTCMSAFVSKGVISNKIPLRVFPINADAMQTQWQYWGGTPYGQRFATLDQITKNNIHHLSIAWVAQTGDLFDDDPTIQNQNTPIQIDNTLFTCTPRNHVIALDIDTGEKKWRYQPTLLSSPTMHCRSLGFIDLKARSGFKPSDKCNQRIFLTTSNSQVIALDATTGEPCDTFANKGIFDLPDLSPASAQKKWIHPSAPLVAKDAVVMGDSAHRVHAISALTGEVLWTWAPFDNTDLATPQSRSDKRLFTQAHAWGEFTYDDALELIYIPTHSITSRYSDNPFSNAVVAIEQKTGKVRWQFQTVQGDQWDFNLTAQPTLVDIPNPKGETIRGLIMATKQGEIFYLNRETGEPLSKIEQQAVPQNSHEPVFWPRQPHSIDMPAIGNKPLQESDMWGLSLIDQLFCRIEFKSLRADGIFTPTSSSMDSLQFPGKWGGIHWGGVSYDPNNQVIFVNDTRIARIHPKAPRNEPNKTAPEIASIDAPLSDFLSIIGIPCQAPPYGTLSAISLSHKKILWQVPVGSPKESSLWHKKVRMNIPIGMPTTGPSLATQSGLIFFSGSQDRYLRAFDSADGSEIWRARLPSGSQAGPMSYISPNTGVQYIVVSAGGAWRSQEQADYVIAFALKTHMAEQLPPKKHLDSPIALPTKE